MALADDVLGSLRWRLIGPFRGGRVVAVAGDPARPEVFYFGSTGGGVWKTTDAGTTWWNVSDGYFRRASVGAIAVSPSDPNVVYVGMGESTIRNTVSHGDGVYVSTDGGASWRHVGLAETQNIGRVRVHPQNPEVAYVAAFGHVWGPNPERGVYRTRDGGRTWEKVLYRDERTGAVDLALDPQNPRILYASLWQARRRPWALESGGPGSGLFKSTDGGDTWTEITRNPGLPRGTIGKIGVAVSPAKPGRVFALVEAEDGGLFLSDDGGANWQRATDEYGIRARPWYYMHVIAHPTDPETVFCLNVQMWRSSDGGRTFQSMPVPHGDLHDLWIDPRDPGRMILGGDGGACVSWNGGLTWSTVLNQPTGEFYHVVCDTRFPYRVYGAQQDNTTVSVPSRSDRGPINQSQFLEVGTGESGYVAVRPDDPDVVFTGNYQGYLARFHARTREMRNVSVWPETTLGEGARDLKYRFAWTYPIVLSPHDPGVLYAAGNRLFRSRDEGASWEVVSPDLTRNDPEKLGPSGGLTGDNTGAEYYCTIFAFAESPVRRGLLWAGTDDGLVHVSDDDGKTWREVTPPGLPAWSLVSIVEPSPHDAATAYVAATAYRLDDFRPYLFKTTDGGASWTLIVDGIAPDHFTRVIREDPVRPGLLFAGTEAGLYVSFDAGRRWHPLGGDLPVVPVHDLVVRDDDLVLATHGRSFWILDDVTLLRQLADDLAARREAEEVRLFTPRRTVRWRSQTPPWMAVGAQPYGEGTRYTSGGGLVAPYRLVRDRAGGVRPVFADAGENPPEGVIVHYWLPRDLDPASLRLVVCDEAGRELRSFRGRGKDEPEPEPRKDRERPEPTVPAWAGYHRFVWDMRVEGPKRLSDGGYGGEAPGPVVPPGRYRVRLVAGEAVREAEFELVKDPRVAASQADLERQFALLQEIAAKLGEVHATVEEIRGTKGRLTDWESRLEPGETAEPARLACRAAREALERVEGELVQTKARSRQENLAHPSRLNAKLASLMGAVASADAAPTRQAEELFRDLSARVDRAFARYREVLAREVAAAEEALRETGLPLLGPRAG
ncbi:MAG: glycosyl hydrolase [Clostridia bacterium]|nr:glycosyl hydrolase [Clostridia bacterium]